MSELRIASLYVPYSPVATDNRSGTDLLRNIRGQLSSIQHNLLVLMSAYGELDAPGDVPLDFDSDQLGTQAYSLMVDLEGFIELYQDFSDRARAAFGAKPAPWNRERGVWLTRSNEILQQELAKSKEPGVVKLRESDDYKFEMTYVMHRAQLEFLARKRAGTPT